MGKRRPSITVTPEIIAWNFWGSVVLSAVPLLAAAAVLMVTRRFPVFRRTAWQVGAVAVGTTALMLVTGGMTLVLVVQLAAWALILRHRLLMVGAAIAFAVVALPGIIDVVIGVLDGPLFPLTGLAVAWAVRIVPPAALLVLAAIQFRRNAARVHRSNPAL